MNNSFREFKKRMNNNSGIQIPHDFQMGRISKLQLWEDALKNEASRIFLNADVKLT